MPDISVDLVERFYAILAIAAIGGMILLGTLRILAIQSDPALDAYATIARAIQARGVIAAWFVATLATIGSLFFSEIAKFTPCTLCWYQRIAMYATAIILVVATIRRRDWTVRPYALTLAVIGAIVSTYHYLVEWFPEIESDGVCSLTVPCNYVWFRRLGFVTIPFMALCGFLAVGALLAFCRPEEER